MCDKMLICHLISVDAQNVLYDVCHMVVYFFSKRFILQNARFLATGIIVQYNLLVSFCNKSLEKFYYFFVSFCNFHMVVFKKFFAFLTCVQFCGIFSLIKIIQAL